MFDYSKLPAYSFRLGENSSSELLLSETVSEKDGVVFCVRDYKGGIRVSSTMKRYDEFSAVEWVSEFENTSGCDSEIISELFDCDCDVPLPHEENFRYTATLIPPEKCTRIYSPLGSVLSEKEFYCDTDEFYGNSYIRCVYPGRPPKYYADDTGRCSEKIAPYFNISKDREGVVAAIGWTGQWHCRLTRENDCIKIQSGIRDVCTKLLAGEKLKTSSIVLMTYSDMDFDEAQNKWRRLQAAHFAPFSPEKRDASMPFACSLWGGMSTEGMLRRLEILDKNKVPETYIWIDAGWYGVGTDPCPDEFEGDWSTHTGDWRVNPNYHPDGLLDVTKKIHDMGKKLILWFEPERVKKRTPPTLAHPEYFVFPDNGGTNLLLNLGDEKARQYCFDTISGLIRTLKVDYYRQDFNFCPLSYWRQCDAPDRKGVSEIRYINGLYKYLDALRAEFPKLLIDNCASGGRRLDIEMMRRTVPLWRSDYMCPANFDPDAAQSQQINFSHWLLYSGSGAGRIRNDAYHIRSCYAGAMTTNYTYSERDDFPADSGQIEWMKKYFDEYLSVRDYFFADMYTLTEKPFGNEVWCAVQYNRAEKCDGLLTIFRRSKAPYDSAIYKLRGLDAEKRYFFRDLDGGGFECTGKEMMQGHKFIIDAPRTSKLYIYTEKR